MFRVIFHILHSGNCPWWKGRKEGLSSYPCNRGNTMIYISMITVLLWPKFLYFMRNLQTTFVSCFSYKYVLTTKFFMIHRHNWVGKRNGNTSAEFTFSIQVLVYVTLTYIFILWNLQLTWSSYCCLLGITLEYNTHWFSWIFLQKHTCSCTTCV